MQLINEFAARLMAATTGIDWEANDRAEIASNNFAGGNEVSEENRPGQVKGLQLGRYPVLVGDIDLAANAESIEETLRKYRNQALIARSYLSEKEVIDLQLMLIAATPSDEADAWVATFDEIQRDDKICRKHIWIKKTARGGESFEQFVARTFLAKPWVSVEAATSIDLDRNAKLVLSLLTKHGISETHAETWIRTVLDSERTPGDMVELLLDGVEVPR